MNVILFASAFAMTGIVFAFVAGPIRRLGATGFSSVIVIAGSSVVLFGIGMYLAFGRPDAVAADTPPPVAAQTTENRPTGTKIASVDSLVAGLEERLRQQPDDGKGWLLLAKTYDHLGRTAESLSAYARARELGVEDSEFAQSIGANSLPIRYPLDPGEIDDVKSLAN